MRLAAILLLAHPAFLLTGTMVRALRYSPFEAAVAAVLLAATIVLGIGVWRLYPTGTPILGFANAVVLAGVISALIALRRRLDAVRAAPSNSHAA